MYESIKNAKRIVVKVGTSTLTYDTGKLNIKRMNELVRVLSDLSNSGKEIVLVSSAAIAIGMNKIGLSERPKEIREKQAISAVGQCELMYLYDKFFGEYSKIVGQILLTRTVIEEPILKENAEATFKALIEKGIIPIVNENDTIATEEIEFGDNDTLSAIVAELIEADLLIIFTDIDGLYNGDPRKNNSAKLIPVVDKINDEIINIAGGAGSNRGTGGMITKIYAGQIATKAGVDMIITNGNNPSELYNILDGEVKGTLFLSELNR